MDKKDMLIALERYYANGNKSRFANKLGISPQAVSTWEKRNTFDIELIYSKCENINATWLLTGEGEMLLCPSITPSVSAPSDCSALQKEVELLRAQLAEEKERSAQYWEMIQKLTLK